MTTQIVTNNFILYGLNRYRNFLNVKEKKYIPLSDEEEVIDFCCEMLARSGCLYPGMFAVFQNGTYMAVTFKYDEENEDLDIIVGKRKDMHFFSKFDAEFRLCCYGLICEIRPGEWAIQE